MSECPYVELELKALSDAWFAARKEKGIFTASSVAHAAGLSGYATPEQYYDTLLHPERYSKMDDTVDTIEGREQEPVIADHFKSKINGTKMRECGIFYLKKCPWIRATPDRLITAGPFRGYFVEIKNSRHVLYERPKVEHITQCHVQMFCTNRTRQFLVYHCNNELRVFIVYFSRNLKKQKTKKFC